MSDGVKVDKGKKGLDGWEIYEMFWSILLYSWICFFIPYMWAFPDNKSGDREVMTWFPLVLWLFTCCAGWNNKQVAAMTNLKGFAETITDL